MTSWLHPSCSPDPQSSQRELHRVPWPLNPEQQWPSEEGKERKGEKKMKMVCHCNTIRCNSSQKWRKRKRIGEEKERRKERGRRKEEEGKRREERGGRKEEEGKRRKERGGQGSKVHTSSNLYGVTKKSVPPARDLRVVRARRSVPSSTLQRYVQHKVNG